MVYTRHRLYNVCNLTVCVSLRDDLGAQSSPTYRRVYASTGSVIRSLESRFRGQKTTHWRNNLGSSSQRRSSIRNVVLLNLWPIIWTGVALRWLVTLVIHSYAYLLSNDAEVLWRHSASCVASKRILSPNSLTFSQVRAEYTFVVIE